MNEIQQIASRTECHIASSLLESRLSRHSREEHRPPCLLNDLSLLRIAPEALALAEALLQAAALPEKAGHDALHIAVSALNGIPYMLTWNCRHLANATMRPMIESVCAAHGFKAPIICTPEELLGAKR